MRTLAAGSTLTLHFGVQHVALAMGEELALQERLLGDLEEDVDVVHSRIGAVTHKIKAVMKRSKECKWWCLVFVLAAILVVLLVVGTKLAKTNGR